MFQAEAKPITFEWAGKYEDFAEFLSGIISIEVAMLVVVVAIYIVIITNSIITSGGIHP
jgi:hypothetical protein